MNLKKIALLGLLLTGSMLQAQAYTVTAGGTLVVGNGETTSVLGAVTTDFNSGSAPYNYAGGGIVTGNLVNTWATPYNDTSPYYSVGPSTSTPGVITFSSDLLYFGFYWGSPDDYNSFTLKNNGATVKTFGGLELATAVGIAPPPLSGDKMKGVYVNIWASGASEYFDQIEFYSGRNALETDNHATLAVPEPETYAMLMAGLGLMGAVARRRKQQS